MNPEWLLFPIRNELGLKVDSLESYWHMINTIIHTQTELVQDYPDDYVLVVYELTPND